jgi:hypothetical protein
MPSIPLTEGRSSRGVARVGRDAAPALRVSQARTRAAPGPPGRHYDRPARSSLTGVPFAARKRGPVAENRRDGAPEGATRVLKKPA